MAIRANKVTVTSTATRLSATNLGSPKSIAIKNVSANTETVYIGGTNGVTTAQGFPLAPGEGLDVDIEGAEAVWGICATTCDVNVLLTDV